MQVFVMGATGYIGSAVVRELVAAGHHVVGLARSDEAAARVRALGATPHRGDVLMTDSVLAAARVADATVNLAQVRGMPGTPEYTQQSLALSDTVAAIVVALHGTGKTYLHTSGTGAYGDTGGAVVDETAPTFRPPFLAGFGDDEVLAAHSDGLRTLVLRPSMIHGGDGGPVSMMVGMTAQSGRAVVIEGGANVQTFVALDDVASAYRLALENTAAHGLYNVTAEYVPMREVMTAVSRAAGLGGEVVSLTREQADAQLGFFAYMLGNNARVSSAKLRHALGWQPEQPGVLAWLAQARAPLAAQ